MKKLCIVFFSLILFFSLSKSVYSRDFLPKFAESINYYGIGVYFSPEKLFIYQEPDDNTDPVEVILWNEFGLKGVMSNLSTQEAFIAFVPQKRIALLTVVDETDDYFQVIYNQKSGAKGWIKKSSSGEFMTWLEFMNQYGRKNGVYAFSDLPETYKMVYSGPDENTQIQKDCSLNSEDMRLKFVRGNWMLVKIVDYNKSTPIGWIRWRDNDGKIYVFPDLRN